MTQSMADACQNGEGECRMTVECHCTSGNMSVSTSMSPETMLQAARKKGPLGEPLKEINRLMDLSRRTIGHGAASPPSEVMPHAKHAPPINCRLLITVFTSGNWSSEDCRPHPNHRYKVRSRSDLQLFFRLGSFPGNESFNLMPMCIYIYIYLLYANIIFTSTDSKWCQYQAKKICYQITKGNIFGKQIIHRVLHLPSLTHALNSLLVVTVFNPLLSVQVATRSGTIY